jgi:hypothetical protein
MTDDLAELRAKIEERIVELNLAGDAYRTAVLSLLPPPPPKYEVKPVGPWWYVVRGNDDVVAFSLLYYPDAEQRAREECARLNGTSDDAQMSRLNGAARNE